MKFDFHMQNDTANYKLEREIGKKFVSAKNPTNEETHTYTHTHKKGCPKVEFEREKDKTNTQFIYTNIKCTTQTKEYQWR